MRRWRLVCGVSIAALVLTSCGGSTRPPRTAHITEHDFALALNTKALAAGSVALDIRNKGPSAHELLAFRTDLPDDQLPLGSDGRINEDALPKAVDTETDLRSGTSRQLSRTLSPGRYVLVCNLQNHYERGMHTVVTVI